MRVRRRRPVVLAPLSPGRRARVRHLLAAYCVDWRVCLAFAVVVGALLLWLGVTP